jgi:Protein of unknown function (DUF1666)
MFQKVIKKIDWNYDPTVEDNLKEKLEDDQKGNYIITSEELEDIMEESIRVFWEFVKADKDETPVILKGLVGPQVELQDPSDYNLMMRLHSILQKVLTIFSLWVLTRRKQNFIHFFFPDLHIMLHSDFLYQKFISKNIFTITERQFLSQFNINIKFKIYLCLVK